MITNKRIFSIIAAVACMPLFASAQTPLGEKVTKAPQHDWVQNAVIYEANVRQGTPERNFKGLTKELPRLKNLGVDVVWLMPIHPISEKNRKGTLGSYYAVKNYKEVNSEFGTMQDFKELVSKAHELGIRVIIDEVCNHTGCDNVWLTSNPEFYARNEKGELYGPYDWTDTYKLDYSNPKLREAMIDVFKFWIEEVDIDGFRFDVAGEVPTDFWVEARKEVEKVKPVLFLAESSKPELMAEAFDIDYAWPMKDVFQSIAATQGVNKVAAERGQKLPKADAQAIPELLEKQKVTFPKGAIHMNMITNHDLNSWDDSEFRRFGPGVGAFAVLSYTLPGVPMLYTGQETGFDHTIKFFDIDEVLPSTKGNEFTAFYEMLNALRHNNSAFTAGRDNGGDITFYPVSDTDVLVFERVSGKDRAVVIVNLSNDAAEVSFKGAAPSVEKMVNYFNPEKGGIPQTLSPWQYAVFTTPIKK